MTKAPTTKLDMYQRLTAGEFGNTFRTWLSVQDAIDDGYTGLVGMRTSLKNGPWSEVNMTLEHAKVLELELMAQGAKFISFMEEVPNEARVMNGEVQRGVLGLSLRYGIGAMHMRQHMATPRYANGAAAVSIMSTFMGEADYGWIMDLLDEYNAGDDRSATVEFTVFSCFVGPHRRNTVVWEVRAY